VPAIFFVRGDFMLQESNKEAVVYAIQKGFIVGNHLFSHKPLASLTMPEFIFELEETEKLIDQAYELAGVARPIKLIRFPYGNNGNENNKAEVQSYLKANGFVLPSFEGVDWECLQQLDNPYAPVYEEGSVDMKWTFDIFEYKIKSGPERNLGLNSAPAVKTRLEKYLQTHSTTEVVLTHDFPDYHYMFEDFITILGQYAEFQSIVTSSSTLVADKRLAPV
jgi:peptidoglycan-N-acetylglucosamine deacetylase